jgi:hypothetical protein
MNQITECYKMVLSELLRLITESPLESKKIIFQRIIQSRVQLVSEISTYSNEVLNEAIIDCTTLVIEALEKCFGENWMEVFRGRIWKDKDGLDCDVVFLYDTLFLCNLEMNQKLEAFDMLRRSELLRSSLDLGENLYWNDMNYSSFWARNKRRDLVRKHCLQILEGRSDNFLRTTVFHLLSLVELDANVVKSFKYLFIALKYGLKVKNKKLRINKLNNYKELETRIIDRMHVEGLLDRNQQLLRLRVRFQELLSKVTD